MSVERYIGTKVHKNDKYKTTRYPKFPKKPLDKYIMAREQDRLDLLANEFYDDPRYWWIIATANPELQKGTLLVPPGLQLRIPAVDPIIIRDKLKEVEANR